MRACVGEARCPGRQSVWAPPTSSKRGCQGWLQWWCRVRLSTGELRSRGAYPLMISGSVLKHLQQGGRAVLLGWRCYVDLGLTSPVCIIDYLRWVNPHNPCLAVFATGSCHVLPFDPRFGGDTCRTYATKYAGKPEKHYQMETQTDSVRDFLQCRTIGVCIAHSRLLGFHVVRSTRPCILLFTDFVQPTAYCRLRDDRHKAKYPDYPHPTFILSKTQQYFFRHSSLKHCRIEMIVRYYSTVGWLRIGEQTEQNTVERNDESVPCDTSHKNYDPFSERVAPGQKFLPPSLQPPSLC